MTARLIAADKLRAFGAGVFQRAGVPRGDAQIAAEILVEANLRGVDTHGIYLSNLYARRLRKGLINPKPRFRFERRRAGVGILDADYSLGQLSTLEAARRAVELARASGVGIVAVKNSNHFGAAAYYGEYCAKQDCIGLVMSDGECDVIPFGGREKFLGTNPLCCCIPAGTYPWFCMDMATSEVAFGKVRAAAEAGRPIPPNWAVDRDGRPVTDATKAYAVVPMSGAKGYALGLMIEILSSRFTGMPYGAHIVRKFDDWEHRAFMGHYVQAIDIAAFCPVEQFKRGMDELLADLKGQPRAPGVDEILIPGEPEWRTRERRLKEGCPIREEEVELLGRLGEEFGVPFPA
ncbi:MAG: Ldh family oxidoreductase [Deltaproteobacteria bacterium]|nr:Ldh family oxidoreductase [Deltaproteobacteria bacterium]MBW2122881.1 Ldh family oxidoreductase [Deltaproteobacteria bacterium]